MNKESEIDLGFAKIIHRHSVGNLAIPGLISLCLVSLYSYLGTPDIEESNKIAFGAGLSVTADEMLKNGRSAGTYDLLGIPLYDALQGTGNRLPLQGSWSQSPEWPLRFIFGWNHYVIARVFLITFATLYLLVGTIRSWRGNSSVLRDAAICVCSLSFAGVFLRVNEWSDTYAQTMAGFAIAVFLVKKTHFQKHDVLQPNVLLLGGEVMTLSVCFSILCSGHPGVLPFSFVLLALIVASGIVCSQHFRAKVFGTVKHHFLKFILVVGPGILICILTFLEVSNAVSGNVFSQRADQSGGFYARGWVNFLFANSIPESIGSYVALFVNLAFLPGLLLILKVAPHSTLQIRVEEEEFLRGGFGGLLVIVVCLHLLFKIKEETPLKHFLKVVSVVNLGSIWFAILIYHDALPSYALGSAAFLMFTQLLPFNVFVGFVLLTNCYRLKRGIQLLVQLNVVFSVIWLFLGFGFLNNNQELVPRRSVPSSWFPTKSQIADLEPLLSKPTRAVMVDVNRRWIAISAMGKQLVAPMNPKTRDSTHLADHIPLDAFVQWPSIDDIAYESQLLDFLSVSQVVVPSSGEALSYLAKLAERDGTTTDNVQKLRFYDADYLLWERNTSSFLLVNEDFPPISRCPILTQKCPLIAQGTMLSYPDTGPIEVCKRHCLWSLSLPDFPNGKLVVLPIGYDSALHIVGSDGQVLSTTDVGGFLSIRTKSLSAGVISVVVRPDLIMGLRVLASYFSLFSPLLLGILSLQQKLLRTRAIQSVAHEQ